MWNRSHSAVLTFCAVQVIKAYLDLEDLRTITSFAYWVLRSEQIPRVDYLILNAGVTGIGWGSVKRTLKTNLERRFAANVVGNQHLVTLLARKLRMKSRDRTKSRVVVVSSRSQHFSPSWSIPIETLPDTSLLADAGFPYVHDYYLRDLKLYGLSKLGNVLLAKEIMRRYKGEIEAVALHPGSSIMTAGGESALLPRLWLALVSPWAKTTVQGAATSIYGALSKSLRGGEYLEDCRVSTNVHPDANDPRRAEDLWRYVASLTKKLDPKDHAAGRRLTKGKFETKPGYGWAWAGKPPRFPTEKRTRYHDLDDGVGIFSHGTDDLHIQEGNTAQD